MTVKSDRTPKPRNTVKCNGKQIYYFDVIAGIKYDKFNWFEYTW